MKKTLATIALLTCSAMSYAKSFDMRLSCEIYGDVAVRMIMDTPTIQIGKAFYGENAQTRVITHDGEQTTVLMASELKSQKRGEDMAMIAYTQKSLEVNSIRLVIPHVGKDVCEMKSFRNIDM